MRSVSTISTVSEENLDAICRELAGADGHLAKIYEKYGAPPLWRRPPTFPTLIHIILEQQVSLASALAAFNKLKETIGDVTPENVLSLSDEEMKSAYFSRQKALYARELAAAVIERRLDLASLSEFPDEDVRSELMKIKGIGRWTSDIFLLMCLLRPDVMPVGDIALYTSWKEVTRAESSPGAKEFTGIAQEWRPYRSVAARLLWHFYLSQRSNR